MMAIGSIQYINPMRFRDVQAAIRTNQMTWTKSLGMETFFRHKRLNKLAISFGIHFNETGLIRYHFTKHNIDVLSLQAQGTRCVPLCDGIFTSLEITLWLPLAPQSKV